MGLWYDVNVNVGNDLGIDYVVNIGVNIIMIMINLQENEILLGEVLVSCVLFLLVILGVMVLKQFINLSLLDSLDDLCNEFGIVE